MKQMYCSTLYKTNGEILTVFPIEKYFTVPEIEVYVQGAYEISELHPMAGSSFHMMINKASRVRREEGSMMITDIYNRNVSCMLGEFILGDVLVVCNIHRKV